MENLFDLTMCSMYILARFKRLHVLLRTKAKSLILLNRLQKPDPVSDLRLIRNQLFVHGSINTVYELLAVLCQWFEIVT